MSKHALILTVAALFISGAVMAQENNSGKVDFYEVVPRHEFVIDGFGGISTFLYKIDGTWPQILSTDALGGGGGINYIWHFHPNVGLMLGADFALYRGAFKSAEDQWIWTCEKVEFDGADRLSVVGVSDFLEKQRYMAVQVPLMFQFMAPMGRGNNFFYAAIGARAGFNVGAKWNAEAVNMRSSYGPFTGWAYEPGEWFFPGTEPGTDIWMDYCDDYSPNLGGKADGSGTTGTADFKGNYKADGDLAVKLLNVMASAELGFRWKLGNGWGLYTGIYADYGFLPFNKCGNNAIISSDGPTPTQMPDDKAHSIMNSQQAPPITGTTSEGDWNIKLGNVQPLRVSTAGAGLKLKLAFGKVNKRPVPVPVIIPPKPDTVVKTVYVRDTVEKVKTVRDTVEKVVRDTVVVIKEVPVEIQETMRELSNTLFEFDKFNLSKEARAALDKVADWLKANPDLDVEISGHTDGKGSVEYNQKLSENRAKSVYDYFVDHGVSAYRLSYKGYGKLQPIATNETDEGRQLNRRVELKILQ